MKKEEFDRLRTEFLAELNERFINDIPDDISLQDYSNYYNIDLSRESKNILSDKIIANSTDWKIGDKFVKTQTIFHRNSENDYDHTSNVWRINEISIYWSENGYYLTYWCEEEKLGYNPFPLKESFKSLDNVDKMVRDSYRVKYWFEKC